MTDGIVTRRYLWKLYPTRKQDEMLHVQRMMMADLWNALLQRREDVYRRERRTLTRFDLEYEITALYRECPEWRALSTWSGRRVNVALDLAYQAFFRRLKQGEEEAGFPLYKRRKDGKRIPHRCASGCKLSPAPRERCDGRESAGSTRNWQLRLKGVDGLIHARGKFPGHPIDFLDADVLWSNGKWWFSLCVEMEPKRQSGRSPLSVEVDCLDCLARVNGEPWTPVAFARLQAMQDHVDRLTSERDTRWKKRAPHDPDWREADDEISRLSAKIARCRNNELHVWTARLVHIASSITIYKPKIKENTQSPKGANVATVRAINRNTLSYAPAMAVQMLKYKAYEAGISCKIIDDTAPAIAVGKALVRSGREIKRIAHKIRRERYGEDPAGTPINPA